MYAVLVVHDFRDENNCLSVSVKGTSASRSFDVRSVGENDR